MLDYRNTNLNALIKYGSSPCVGGTYLLSFFILIWLTDPEYKKFLETYCVEEQKTNASPETLLGDTEAKTRALTGLFCSFLLCTLLRYVFTFIELYIYLLLMFIIKHWHLREAWHVGVWSVSQFWKGDNMRKYLYAFVQAECWVSSCSHFVSKLGCFWMSSEKTRKSPAPGCVREGALCL